MSKTPQRARIYARISDDSEGRELGVARQVEDCKALAERLGWTLHAEPAFVDNDISASTKSKARRPGFESLLTSIESGDTDGILYYSTSRLTRRPIEYEAIIKLVDRTGVRLATVVSGDVDLTTADGRHIGRILAAGDAAEAERTSERVTRAMKQRRDHGRPSPAGRCFGFESGGEVVIPAEAEAIRLGAQMVLEGKSVRTVGKAWTDAGLTLSGKPWGATPVRRILVSPRTAGLIAHKGEIVGAGTMEAILDMDTWAAVKAALAAKAVMFSPVGRGGYTGTPVHLLAGFVWCGRCENRTTINALRGPDGSTLPRSALICRKPAGCNLRRNMNALEAYVVEVVEAALRELADKPSRSAEEFESVEAVTVAALEAERDRLGAHIAKLKQRVTSGAIELDLGIQLLGAAKAELAATLEKLTRQPDALRVTDRDTLTEWQSGDTAARRRILSLMVNRITVEPIGKVGPRRAVEAIPSTTVFDWVD